MIRGTTPTHIFHLSFDTGTLKKVRVTYEQLGRIVVEKTEADAQLQEDSIKLKLTQEETLKFNHKSMVRVQLKVLTNTGTVLASPIWEKQVDDILNEEVLQ